MDTDDSPTVKLRPLKFPECRSCPWLMGDIYQRDCDFPYCVQMPGESLGYNPYDCTLGLTEYPTGKPPACHTHPSHRAR